MRATGASGPLAPPEQGDARRNASGGAGDAERTCRRTALVCGGTVVGWALLVLLGWSIVAGLHRIPDPLPTWVTWPLSAALFLLAGSALLVRARGHSGHWARWYAAGAALVAAGWGFQNVLTFVLEKVGGEDLRTLEDLLFADATLAKMSPLNGASFFLTGCLLLVQARSRRPALQSLVGLGASLVGLFNLALVIGYLSGGHRLFAEALTVRDAGSPSVILTAQVAGVSFTSAATWLCFSLGLVFAAGPRAWPLRPLCGSSTKALLLRAFLPLMAALVLAYDIVRAHLVDYLQETWGSVHPEFLVLGSVLCALLSVAVVSVVVAQIARVIGGRLDRAEAERTRALESLRQARDAAEAASRAKSQFLANMSHELRTPLNAVIGYSEMLQEEARDVGQEDFLPDLTRINTAGKHLLGVINDILDLSKIEAGKIELCPETFDVAGLVQEVAATIRPVVEKKGNTFEVRCGPDLGLMRADPTRLKQCLFNLLSNAGKFTENGTVCLEVGREVREGRDRVVFRVSDTGIGMTAEQMQNLYQPFTQADASTTRKHGGTGLGLSICRRLSQMMGGNVICASEYGKGTTFTLQLPAESPSPAVTPGAPAAPVAPPGDSAEEGPGRVLVVDDDESVRDMLARFLVGEGFEVTALARGEEALAAARALHPQAITLDVMMPGMDGWAVLSALKSNPDLADIPVIMLTIVDDRNLGYTLGAADYLTKPIDRERLLGVLKKHCRKLSAGLALVVEDDAPTREMFRRMLEKDGWRVAEAGNGREALQVVEQRSPGLILLDLMMPGMDGFEFLAELRHHPEWQPIPVVVVTAKDLTPEERLFLNGSLMLSGCVKRVLQKGQFGREDLLREVRDLVSAGGG